MPSFQRTRSKSRDRKSAGIKQNKSSNLKEAKTSKLSPKIKNEFDSLSDEEDTKESHVEKNSPRLMKRPVSHTSHDRKGNAGYKKKLEFHNSIEQLSVSDYSEEDEGSSESKIEGGSKKYVVSESTLPTSMLKQRKINKDNCENDIKKESGKDTRTNLKGLWMILFVFIAVFLLAFYDNFSTEAGKQVNLTKTEVFQNELIKIKKDFPKQRPRLWKIANISLERNLRTQYNSHPAVLLLASSSDAYSTLQCLAKKLSDAFSSTCDEVIEVNGQKYKDVDSVRAKSALDATITDGFTRGSCAALISRFDALPPYATTTFYQFCENDNAPFKNVAVIFAVKVEPGSWNNANHDLNNVPEKLWDEIVSDYLSASLKTRDDTTLMTDEMIYALLSRITPSVVWVTEESPSASCW